MVPSEIFHGRDELVDDIVDTIVNGVSARIAIMGPPGMGKTSSGLAVMNHPRIQQLFEEDFRYSVPCDRIPTISLFRELLPHILSVTASPDDSLGDILLRLQKDNTRRRIILLDNFETFWDPMETMSEAEHILSSLSSISNLTILITMRGSRRPRGVKWKTFTIKPLSLDAARQKFLDISSYYDNHLDDLLITLDCVPLAVTLVAMVGGDGIMPSKLLQYWETEQTAFLKVNPGGRLGSVDFSIRLSLNSTPMVENPDAITLLSTLARLPGGIRSDYWLHVTTAISKVGAAERALLSTALAYHTSPDTFQLLSPIRSYMLRHHPLDVPGILALRTFYFRLSEEGESNPGSEGFYSAVELISQEESNIRSVIMDALKHEPTLDAIHAAIHYSQYLHWNLPSTEVLETAIDSIRKHPSSNLGTLMPLCLQRLGTMLRRLDRYHRAIAALTEAEEGFKTLGDTNGTANCHLELAPVYRLQEKDEQAIASLATAQEYFEYAGNRIGISQCHQSRGFVLQHQHKYTEAATQATEAEAICIDLNDHACVIRSRYALGFVYARHCRSGGDHCEEAIKLLSEARNWYLTYGPRIMAEQSLYSLGIVYYSQRKYDQANSALIEAYKGFEALNNHGSMALSLLHLGEMNRFRGYLEEARVFYSDCRRKSQEIDHPLWVAYCSVGEARVLAALHRVDDAKQAYHDGLTILRNSEVKNDEYIIQVEGELQSLESMRSLVLGFLF